VGQTNRRSDGPTDEHALPVIRHIRTAAYNFKTTIVPIFILEIFYCSSVAYFIVSSVDILIDY